MLVNISTQRQNICAHEGRISISGMSDFQTLLEKCPTFVVLGSSFTLAVDVEPIRACSYSSSAGSSFTLTKGGEGDLAGCVSVCVPSYNRKKKRKKKRWWGLRRIYLFSSDFVFTRTKRLSVTTFFPFITAAGDELCRPTRT